MRSHNKSHHQWRKEIKTKRVFNFTKRTADLFVEKGRGGGILHSNHQAGLEACVGAGTAWCQWEAETHIVNL